jgi:hypothetical protein
LQASILQSAIAAHPFTALVAGVSMGGSLVFGAASE